MEPKGRPSKPNTSTAQILSRRPIATAPRVPEETCSTFTAAMNVRRSSIAFATRQGHSTLFVTPGTAPSRGRTTGAQRRGAPQYSNGHYAPPVLSNMQNQAIRPKFPMHAEPPPSTTARQRVPKPVNPTRQDPASQPHTSTPVHQPRGTTLIKHVSAPRHHNPRQPHQRTLQQDHQKPTVHCRTSTGPVQRMQTRSPGGHSHATGSLRSGRCLYG